MIKLRKALCVGLALGLLVSSQASARRIIVDQGDFIPTGTFGAGCTIGGAACGATTLPFFFDFGAGSTNLAYIYDRGVISFGDSNPGWGGSQRPGHGLWTSGHRAALCPRLNRRGGPVSSRD